MRELSGDHAGVNAPPVCFVSACRADPSGCMTQTFCVVVAGVRRM